jgi:signal transduction histidine kinase
MRVNGTALAVSRMTRSRIALPAIAAALSLLATLGLWQSARRDQTAQMRAESTRVAGGVVGHLLTQYNVERQQLMAMGDQLSFAPEAWPNWSRAYLVGQPIHRSLLWIDRDLVAQQVAGSHTSPLTGLALTANGDRAAALRAAIASHEEVVLRADDLQDSRVALLVAQPVYTRDGFAGFTAATLDIDTMLRLTLRPHEETGFNIAVRTGGREIYRSAGSGLDLPDAVLSARSVALGPLGLQVVVWPTSVRLVSHWNDVPVLVLGFGLLVTLLLSLTTAVAQAAGRRSAAIERVNHRLAAEVARRQHAQQELQQMAAELTRSNHELEDFAAIASHDLRAPLQKMKSFADLLDEDYKPCLDAEGRDVLQRLRRSTHRMQRLVDDLLELARVRAKGSPFTRVDLAVVARDVLSDLEPVLTATGGFLEIGDLPAIDADPTQMHQLLQNLAINGLKFQRPDAIPLVRIDATTIENPLGGPPLCRLRVADNGIGFDNKYAERIFRPFERLHGQQDYEGSGMGLAVCAKIAERHGGTIAAYGVPGEGASFLVTLPVRHAPTAPNQRLVTTAEVEAVVSGPRSEQHVS